MDGRRTDLRSAASAGAPNISATAEAECSTRQAIEIIAIFTNSKSCRWSFNPCNVVKWVTVPNANYGTLHKKPKSASWILLRTAIGIDECLPMYDRGLRRNTFRTIVFATKPDARNKNMRL